MTYPVTAARHSPATEALRATLTQVFGPVEPFEAQTDEGRRYIGFGSDQPPVASVQSTGARWAVVNERSGHVVAHGSTPEEAMQNAADPTLWRAVDWAQGTPAGFRWTN